MKTSRAIRSFTLLEVLIAVGLFVSAITVVIGFIAGLSRQGADTHGVLAARGLPEPLKLELTRLSAVGMDSLAGRVPVMASPLAGGLPFASARDVARVDSLEYLTAADPIRRTILPAGMLEVSFRTASL